MAIVGGLDLHRKQITYDYVDTETGQLWRGRIAPADRRHFARWLRRFAGRSDVRLAVEACTGWRYVVEELGRAGITALLADPAETAARRGRKRRAKSDRTDSELMRELVADDRVPQCWIPPSQVLEYRALLELYHDLRTEHTAWVQRIHAVCLHQGTEDLGGDGVLGPAGRERLARVRAELSPIGQLQVDTYLEMIAKLDEQLAARRGEIIAAARHLRGARQLMRELYGVGPLTALALCCWLGGDARFSSSRQAVRFAGLDVTVYSSDGKRSRGHLSRQGPPVLRWLLFEAAKTSSRATAPTGDHAYYSAVKARIGGKRAALSQARRILRRSCHILTDLGEDCFAHV